jgi:hypothetical protein
MFQHDGAPDEVEVRLEMVSMFLRLRVTTFLRTSAILTAEDVVSVVSS